MTPPPRSPVRPRDPRVGIGLHNTGSVQAVLLCLHRETGQESDTHFAHECKDNAAK